MTANKNSILFDKQKGIANTNPWDERPEMRVWGQHKVIDCLWSYNLCVPQHPGRRSSGKY